MDADTKDIIVRMVLLGKSDEDILEVLSRRGIEGTEARSLLVEAKAEMPPQAELPRSEQAAAKAKEFSTSDKVLFTFVCVLLGGVLLAWTASRFQAHVAPDSPGKCSICGATAIGNWVGDGYDSGNSSRCEAHRDTRQMSGFGQVVTTFLTLMLAVFAFMCAAFPWLPKKAQYWLTHSSLARPANPAHAYTGKRP